MEGGHWLYLNLLIPATLPLVTASVVLPLEGLQARDCQRKRANHFIFIL